jgi:hypothetical protein
MALHLSFFFISSSLSYDLDDSLFPGLNKGAVNVLSFEVYAIWPDTFVMQKTIIVISDICLQLFFQPALTLNENPQ